MIKTFTGPMHSGKTKQMMDVYKGIFNKDHLLCFKPAKDDRDDEIKSKDYEDGIPCIFIEKLEDILLFITDDITTIFIDEIQMFECDISVLNYLSLVKDIDVYTAGLNMTSEQQPFGIMPQILAISDEIENIKASCYDCGRSASFTYYEGVKKEDILVGDEGYVPLCNKCLIKRKKKNGIKLEYKKV